MTPTLHCGWRGVGVGGEAKSARRGARVREVRPSAFGSASTSGRYAPIISSPVGLDPGCWNLTRFHQLCSGHGAPPKSGRGRSPPPPPEPCLRASRQVLQRWGSIVRAQSRAKRGRGKSWGHRPEGTGSSPGLQRWGLVHASLVKGKEG